jgi:hypothetical protein
MKGWIGARVRGGRAQAARLVEWCRLLVGRVQGRLELLVTIESHGYSLYIHTQCHLR